MDKEHIESIKERARKFVDALCDRRCKKCNLDLLSCRFYNDLMSFIAGAQSEHSELTKWYDPSDPPLDDRYVVLKLQNKDTGKLRYTVGYYKGWWHGHILFVRDKIIGWREIHE